MSEKNKITFNLVLTILHGLIYPIFFVWFFWADPKFLNPLERDFSLIVQKKIIANGVITKAKWFEDAVDSYNDKYIGVNGYEYSYAFTTNNGEQITSEIFTYHELPNNKQISQIPFQVNIEYLERDPKINRIVGLNTDKEGLWYLFRSKILGSLLFFIFICYFTFKIIEKGFDKYRTEKKHLFIGDVTHFMNQTYLKDEQSETTTDTNT